MLLKFWVVICSFAITSNVESCMATTLLNITECASPLPCLTKSTLQTTTTTSTITSKTLPTRSKAHCKNCPLPDCSMVSNGTTFPYANHCKLFYLCINASAEVCVCPNGYWYDHKISKCMLCDLVLNCEANKD